MTAQVVLSLPEDVVDAIAERVAEIMLTRQAGSGRSTKSSREPETKRPGHADLGAAIALFLADRDCASQQEIARAVHARDEAVRDKLRADPRFQLLDRCRSKPSHHANAKCWASSERLVPPARTRRGRDGRGAPDPEPIRDRSAAQERCEGPEAP